MSGASTRASPAAERHARFVPARPEVSILEFLGAAETVTGSRFLVDTRAARVLVDCGLFQGLKPLRLRNWEPFPVDPASIDAVVLTHAHVDHSGYLPALSRDGFRGPIFATPGTVDLCGILLPDAGRLQEEEADYANRKGYSKHRPALALYSEKDADAVLRQLRAVPFGEPLEVAEGVRATFRRAGHILGSATITLELDDPGPRTLVFSGDLGRPDHPLLLPPEPIPPADVLVIESTYGDRRHDDDDAVDAFADSIVKTVGRGGVVLIPAFAVDRTEVVLFHLARLMRCRRIPEVPVFVDSPMALAALEVYRNALRNGGPDVRPRLAAEPDCLDPGHLVEVREVRASKALNAQRGPAIILSASGMATGGRVLHHLAHRLPDARNTVILVGFQAAGTRGRRLLEGASSVKMLGRYVPVRAEVTDVVPFSVHADQGELIGWLRRARRAPEVTYVVHGEPPASRALRDAIGRELGWSAITPGDRERVRVDAVD